MSPLQLLALLPDQHHDISHSVLSSHISLLEYVQEGRREPWWRLVIIVLLLSSGRVTREKISITTLHSLQYRAILPLCLPQPLGDGGSQQLLQRNIHFPVTQLTSAAFLSPNHSRSDSDIVLPYGGLTRLPSSSSGEERPGLPHLLAGKTGACLWRASHCWTDSAREDLVQQISRYLPVTIIGKCANQVRPDSAGWW